MEPSNTEEIINRQVSALLFRFLHFSKVLAQRRKFLDDLVKRKFIYSIGFDIYGGVAGLYDFGPIGCAIKNNLEQAWREHFVLEEDMLEITATCMTPKPVLEASGHVERFSDLIVKDVKNGAGFRADKLLIEVLEKQLEKPKNLTPEQILELKTILNHAETYNKVQMKEVFQKLKIKSPDTGNDLSDPEEFNLMFATQIGPSGNCPGFLRPETAQGIFVNFQKLLDFNAGRVPFASAQIGLGFRNEISPRMGILRVREFQMAEIEHFVDPLDKSHPKFKLYKDYKLPLFSQKCQEDMAEPIRDLSLEQAVAAKIINNETLAYFMCRTYLFLVKVGVNKNNIRFRQHKKDEMAHYASDCWDAEIELSYGWVECVGIADRACYDLSRHSTCSKTALQAGRRLSKPKQVKILSLIPNKAKIGKEFKQSSKALLGYLEGLSEEQKEKLRADIATNAGVVVKIENQDITLNKDLVSFTEEEKTVMEEKFVPSVIEPSFGISRILYAVLEHSFRMRDEKRTYLNLPPLMAPVKCSILTVINLPEFAPFVNTLRVNLKRMGISCKVDDGGSSIGRRYARTDEIGIPFGITVDKLTVDEKTVTLREARTTKQVRISIEEVITVVHDLSEGFLLWEDVLKKYPLFEVKEEAEEEEKSEGNAKKATKEKREKTPEKK